MRTDVCVIGAGPAGLTVAHELLGSGLHILVLEAGSASPPTGGVDVDTTVNVGLPYCPQSTRSSGVGGSSLRWNVETPLGPRFIRLKELDEIDFEDRPWLTTSGWPLRRASLAPYYRRARELFGIGPAVDGQDAVVQLGVERRVYSFAPADTFTSRIPGVLRDNPHVTLHTGCTVTDVRTDRRNVTSLGCRSQEGQEFTVEARVYVLAGGAIENARLLLASTSASPTGLGNSHDQVGRHFMEHPHYVSGIAVPIGGASARRPPSCDLSEVDGTVQQDKFALAPEALRREGLLNAAYKVKPYDRISSVGFGRDAGVDQPTLDAYFAARLAWRRRQPGNLTVEQVVRLGAAVPALGRYAAQRARLQAGGVASVHDGARVMVMGEQEPSPHSRVRLGSKPDRFGVPLAELDWRLTPFDIASMVRGQQLVAAGLGAAVGARVISTLGPEGVPTPGGGAHHMGTTRMSTHPSSGVVDETCRVHEVGNLFVAGSSVFPTGGAANPTLSIVALAARLADHIAREVGSPAALSA